VCSYCVTGQAVHVEVCSLKFTVMFIELVEKCWYV
jgi:hypothetical protein